MRKCRNSAVALAVGVVVGSVSSSAFAQLRVVSMNGANSESTSAGPRNPWMQTILSAMGSTVSDDPTIAGNSGIAKPIDVLALQEVYSAGTTSAQYAALLNSMYPGSNYQYSSLNGATTGAGTQGLVYNANAVTLVGHTTVGTASSSGAPRQVLRYQLRPVGYDASADVYIYNSHYKSATGDETRRNVEATAIRANADALGAGKNIIYLGDLNVYTSTEPMYQTLLAAGNGKANDPINKPGNWANNSSFKNIHSQSPYSSATAAALGTGFTGGTTGGMDDRFDQQLVTTTMVDTSGGVSYIPNSYSAFGNNGTGPINSSINASTNYFPGTTAGQRNGALLDALAGTLDHLPIVADYTIPAKMTASVTGTVPTTVITGGSVAIPLNVANTAAVSFANGADALDYNYAGAGALSGSGTGTDAALGGSNSHSITLSTAGIGPKSGSVSVAATSEATATGTFSQNVNYNVIDHAAGSFSPTTAGTTAKTIDFGYVPAGSATRTEGFTVSNVAGPNAQAGLDVDSVTSAGSTARLMTNAVATSNLAAGGTLNYAASLNSAVAGDFTATHTLGLSDQDLPGAAARPSLVLTTTSRVFTVASFPVTGYMFLPANEPLTTGSFSIGAGVTLTKTGPGNMTVNGPHNNGAGSNLVINGGTTTFNSDAGPSARTLSITANAGTAVNFNATQHLASLSLNGATSTLANGPEKFLVTNALSITNGGKLDLRDNDLVIDYTGTSPITTIESLVRSGFNDGDFLGSGITSGIAAEEAGFVLAVADNALLADPFTTFFGNDVDLTTVLVKFTHRVDIDLDGRVTDNDAATFAANYNAGQPAYWTIGDVDYDGVFTDNDAAIFAANYNGALPSMPEPGSLGLLGLMGVGLVRRRTRRAN